MGEQGVQQAASDEPLNARAVLDAGGDAPDRLTAALHRRLRELAIGQVVEIVSHQPESHAAVLSWCRLTGQALVLVRQDGAQLRLWIRKARPLAGEEQVPPVWVAANNGGSNDD